MDILKNFKLNCLIYGFEGAKAIVELFYENNYRSLKPQI
jgi:hypothetical protein